MSKGRFVWFDLMTTDENAAKAFYTEVAGWKTEPMMDGQYTMLKAGDEGIGGIMALPEEAKQMGAPPHWIGYVATDDVDATAARAEALGGKIHKGGTDIPGIGRFAMLADPQGASFAVYSSKSPDEQRPSDERGAGRIGWHELNTTDYESAWKFYSQLFGWEHAESMDMGPGLGTYFMFRFPATDGSSGGMSNVASTMNAPPHWLYYVTVDDIDAAVKRITDRGGKILNGPMEVPGGGKIAQCMDPQGAAFAVYAQ